MKETNKAASAKKFSIFIFFILINLNFVSAKSGIWQEYSKEDFKKGNLINLAVSDEFQGSLELKAHFNFGRYISEEKKTDFLFNEAVISWCANTPGNCALVFYLRVKSKAKWSKWFRMGSWGDLKIKVKKSENDSSAVKIDFLTLKEKSAFIQYRIDFYRKSNLNPRVRLISLTYRNNEEDKNKNLNQVIPNKILSVPYYSQGEANPEISARICAPASIAMILNYYGINKNLNDVAMGCFDQENNIFGNWPFNTAYAGESGLYAWVKFFNSLEELKTEISKNYPLIIAIAYKDGELKGSPNSSSDGHLLVVCGFNEKGVIVNDPAFNNEKEGRLIYDYQELEKAWNNSSKIALLFRLNKNSINNSQER
ncbi:MAG: peptidase C39 family protein [Armatimonadetes bacterium]|nr:peptidase C39 family protein [Armatimonadota bacterium]